MDNSAIPLLGGLSRQQFLDKYWQKKPLLVRQALPQAASFSTPDELAGLSLEDEIESRIITGAEGKVWSLQPGPFTEKTFQRLPSQEWTLLVQAVNFYLPQFTELLTCFDFLPHWRVDDVMASYAVTGGSVGPHFDRYDVFLIQGHGKRHWKIGQLCDDSSLLLDHPDLKLLKHFQSELDWVLEPGDMLYLPPNIAHYGVAENECITYSLGFQAPSLTQVAEYFCDDILERNLGALRYIDPALKANENRGKLTEQSVERFKTMLLRELENKQTFSNMLARMLSEPKYSDYEPTPNETISNNELVSILDMIDSLYRDEASRFLYSEAEDGNLALYVNGSPYRVPNCQELVCYLCDNPILDAKRLRELTGEYYELEWLCGLYNKGLIYYPDEIDSFE